MDAALQSLVRRRAHERCEYCGMPELFSTTPFQFDHIIAQFHGGALISENLALACFHCNNFKGTNLSGYDALSGEVHRLYNPRRDKWSDHFVCEAGQIVALTAIGRATVQTLRLNLPQRLAVRRSLLAEGVSFN